MMKLIPLIMVASGGAANKDKITEQVKRVMNISKIAATQIEVNDLSKMIYLDSLDEFSRKAMPTEENFSEYCRKSLKNKKGIGRDTSKDQWGNPYILSYEGRSFIVRSAGLDGQYETDDDIYSGYDL